MFSFNFFKKKEEKYNLDDYSLPSLSEEKANPPQADDNSLAGDKAETSHEFDDNPSPSMSEQNTLETSPDSLSPNSHALNSKLNESSMDTSSIHNEVSRVKIDTMEAKLSLVEAKMTSMDHKIELILKILESEVSDETKKKIKLNEMIKPFKK